MLEEAEKRDHRRLGREMDLFHFQDDAPGTVFWHPKGWTLFQGLITYMRRRQVAEGYVEVNSPQLLERSLWETSGHWETYHANMFVTETEDERVFALKPMNCPGHVQIFKHGLKSYRELPIKIAEFGCVHRYEPSGALHGLMRVRAFTQDDAHIFCSEDQIAEQCLDINQFMLSIYKDFDFEDIHIKLATRPEKRVGADELWDKAETAMMSVLDQIKRETNNRVQTSIAEGDGAFYGPKFEYHLRDAIGRTWQCGTTQVDFNLPARFGAFYIDANSEKRTPVMIHRAMFGSLERFMGILTENTAGHFPLWLAPVQAVIATIVSDADEYALKVAAELRRAGLRVETDLRNEKINYKVREHSLAKAPVILVVGKREAEEGKVAMRRLGSNENKTLTLAEVKALLIDEGEAPDLKRARA
jgi:threonyl-tRNA synthetase